ncbi:MAG: hypothetical protein ACRDHW_07120, partial [Ktedonobacteraceae bacterium]
MKKRMKWAGLLTLIGLVLSALVLASVDEAARPSVVGGLVGVLALAVGGGVLYLRMYPSWVVFQSARQAHRTQRHEGHIQEHTRQLAAYDLEER